MTNTMLLGIGAASAGGLVAVLSRPAWQAFRKAAEQDDPGLRSELERAGIEPAKLPTYLLFWRGMAAASFLFTWFVLGMPPVAIVLAIMVYRGGPIWIRRIVLKQRRRVNEQVAGVARSLAGQVRVGLPLAEALNAVSQETPDPFGSHLRRTARQIAQGSDVRTALGDLRQRVQVDAVSAMTVALQVATERGGKLAEVLDRLAHSAEEIVRIERKRETDTAAGRLMVTLMSLFPAAFLVFFYFLDPELIGVMSTTTGGQVVLAVVGVLIYLSTRWAARILAKVE